MAKFPEAEARLSRGKYVCKKCKSVTRSTPMKVLQGKISCRSCGGRSLRVMRKK